MISYQQLFDEIERQAQQAKQATNQQAMREALAAIRALAEVGLSGEKQAQLFPRKASFASPSPLSASPMQGQSLESKPLEEEDGSNGASIFDF